MLDNTHLCRRTCVLFPIILKNVFNKIIELAKGYNVPSYDGVWKGGTNDKRKTKVYIDTVLSFEIPYFIQSRNIEFVLHVVGKEWPWSQFVYITFICFFLKNLIALRYFF